MKTVEEKLQELLSLRDIDNLRIFKYQKEYILILYYKAEQPSQLYSSANFEQLVNKAYTHIFHPR